MCEPVAFKSANARIMDPEYDPLIPPSPPLMHPWGPMGRAYLLSIGVLPF